jgi:hypothetical protein
MRRLLRLSGGILGVAASAYFVVFAYRSVMRHDLRSLCTGPMVVGIVVAAISYASTIPTSSWAWGRLLGGTGVRFPTLQLNMIMGMTQIAKYVPGSVGQHLGRTAMSIQRGIPAGAVFVTLLVEMLLAVAAAVVVGLLGLGLAARGTATLPLRNALSAALVAVGLGITLLGLLMAIRRPPGPTRWFAAYLGPARPVPAPGVRALSTAFVAYVVNYVVIGLGLYAIAFAAMDVPPAAPPFFVGVFALSWVAGFVAPGAPAGLGVREGVMAALLAPTLDGTTALEIIVAFRVATTLGDLFALAWGGALYLLDGRPAAGGPAVSAGTDPSHGT